MQGMGRMGQFHAKLSIEYCTPVVGGVAPGKGGSVIDGTPVGGYTELWRLDKSGGLEALAAERKG